MICAYVCSNNLIYNSQRLKFLPQKLKNGFTVGDEGWRVHSVNPTDENSFVRCGSVLCAKSYEIKKYRPTAGAAAAAVL